MSVAASSRAGADVCILLVHGACHGPWCWEEVEDPLSSRGWTVRTVDLPLTSLRDDAAVVRDGVRDANRLADAVLLVGHSYGGVVISEAGHEAGHLVYCAATMPDPGESASDILPRLRTQELTDALELVGNGSVFSLNPERAVPAFYNRCSEEQVARAVPRLRPMHLACMNEAVSRSAWLEVPASYIVCTDDNALAPSYQREQAERLGDYIVLDTDHSMFYSASEQFIDRLDALAGRLHKSVPPV